MNDAESLFEIKQKVWHEIVQNLELPSTRLLVNEHVSLYDFVESINQQGDPHIIIRLKVAPFWHASVRSRLGSLENSATEVLGSVEVLLMEAEN